MSDEQRPVPTGVSSLDARIRNYARANGHVEHRVALTVRGTVVGQMLPEGVVKGGFAMTLRLGIASTRFSTDFDTARQRGTSVDDYIDRLEHRLAQGWGDFRGTVVERRPASPPDVPPDYVTRPLDARLSYKGRAWGKVEIELGNDELGSADMAESRISDATLELFRYLGLPTPAPVPLMRPEHQIAQKLHACTEPDRDGRNERAHDLVDLQLLLEHEQVDLADVCRRSRRLFAYRQGAPWPPTVRPYPGWETLYAAEAEGLGVCPTVDEAVAWANDLVAKIEAAGQPE